MTETHSSSARSGTSGDVWEKVARGGYAASGVIHLILGYLIVRLALGSGGEASQSSALEGVRDLPAGVFILWAVAIASFGLAAWQGADAFRHHDENLDRAKAAGKAVLYLGLAGLSLSVAAGGGSGGSDSKGIVATVMEAPLGRIIVGLAALGIIAGGAFHIYKGWTKKFEEDLSHAPRTVKIAGMVGYPAKGFALGVVGVLFGYAAITADPDKAEGMDGAIQSLLDAPGGPVLVSAVGVGFAAYGVYSFGRARYARM